MKFLLTGAMALLLISAVSSADVLYDNSSYPTAGNSQIYNTGNNGYGEVKVAQSFVVPTSSDFALTSVSMALRKSPPDEWGFFEQSCDFHLYDADSAGKPGNPIASLGSITTLTDQIAWYTLSVETTVNLTAGERYFVVADVPYLHAAEWYFSADNSSADGNLVLLTTSADPTWKPSVYSAHPMSLTVVAQAIPEASHALPALALPAFLLRRRQQGNGSR